MLKGLAKLILKVGDWTTIGAIPDVPKAVFIAAPHTSNWDGIWMLVYKVAIGIDIRFFAKDTLFWFPLGSLLTWLGGIPLDRSHAGSAVRQAVDMFNDRDRFYFGLAPEGTRKRKSGWKSGFYRIAREAGVPIYFGMIDYEHKVLGIAGEMPVTGDAEVDIQTCAKFYDDIQGRKPENMSPVRFE